ncbi:hypothetical protein K458DRAFT_314759 [Lentithecium fluviatile CBS 122367]|uniref:Uncharacterized protein n=1 Tax=Lentithecium fluviatile CBS 122367 TaxID=1168545 RepID=A0A6G1IMK3_9PLEO|nr:hypothetical protein K458DRAFT_314759 [Lentithecium fluviatile CBS 122367]
MEFNIGLLVFALHVTGVLSVAAPDAAYAALAAECGDLGVMEIPDGAPASEYRRCKKHPLGNDKSIYETSLAPSEEGLERRAADPRQLKGSKVFGRAAQRCYYDTGLGCSGGSCWQVRRSLGDGKWC